MSPPKFLGIVLEPKWLSFIGRCKNNGDNSQNDLTKSSYQLDMKYKYSIILLYFLLH